MPRSTTFHVQTPDGLCLLGRRWRTASRRLGRALLIHGVGEHSGRYDEVAGVMTALGIEVVSYDQRGFGRSAGNKGEIPQDDTLVTDAAMMFDRVTQEGASGEPAPFLVAHSMGGTIAAYAVASRAITPRGLILSSPAIDPRINDVEKAILALLLPAFPNLPLNSGIKPEQVTRDKAIQRAIKADRLMHTTVTPRLVLSIVHQGAFALANADSIRTPTLLLVAGHDLIVHAETTRKFSDAITQVTPTFRRYPRLFHEVFNELPADRKRVFADFDQWLRNELGFPISRPPARRVPVALSSRRTKRGSRR